MTRADSSGSAPGPFALNGGVALMCLIWGSTWLVVKEGLADLPPITAVAWRFAAAGLIFAGLVPILRPREGGVTPPAWLWAVQGLLTFAYPYSLLYWVETVIPSGLAAVLWAVFPMMNAVIGERLLPDQKLVRTDWLGFVVGFAGVAVLFATDLASIGGGAVGAAALYLTAPLVSAFANVLVKRHGGGVSSVVLNRNGLLFGAVLTGAAAWLFESGRDVTWTPTAVFSVAYLTVVGTVVTFGLYFWLLRYASSHKLALIAYVIPALALLFGWGLGDESVDVSTVGGTALILVGVAMVARR